MINRDKSTWSKSTFNSFFYVYCGNKKLHQVDVCVFSQTKCLPAVCSNTGMFTNCIRAMISGWLVELRYEYINKLNILIHILILKQ